MCISTFRCKKQWLQDKFAIAVMRITGSGSKCGWYGRIMPDAIVCGEGFEDVAVPVFYMCH